MFAISADFTSQTLSYGYKGALFSSFLKLLSDMPMTCNTARFKVVPNILQGPQNL